MIKYLILGVYFFSAPTVVYYIWKTSKDLLKDAGVGGAIFILVFSAVVSPALVISAISSMVKHKRNEKTGK